MKLEPIVENRAEKNFEEFFKEFAEIDERQMRIQSFLV